MRTNIKRRRNIRRRRKIKLNETIKESMQRLWKEMAEIGEEQERIREGQAEVKKRFEEKTKQGQGEVKKQLKEETKHMFDRSTGIKPRHHRIISHIMQPQQRHSFVKA
ncbi:uncharacterized protein LOC119990535 [Tripterygium wilfordii]|uniref:uncharacterized protein LOC119990535 n=1 Tax=Tripterygium wilfordii TaxID=458696 RepID=UPI0018F8607E|nr:uncharacterized protein LOC119990535 [Tripterygium wilfordii]